jgi:hypothetical protein
MEPTPDELAGVVDLFGTLTRAELCRGLAELAFKRGEEYDPDRFAGTVEAAVRSYHLVAVDPAEAGLAGPMDGEVLVAGPVAFPELPAGATDLPHILDVPERDPDIEGAATAAAERFRQDAVTAIEKTDHERVRELLDISYELETWGGLDLSATRERMDAELARDR